MNIAALRTQWFVYALLAAWASIMIVIGACLMVSHWVTLPTPQIDNAGWTATLANHVEGRWTAFHFLYGECPCSRRVLKHVIERGPREDVAEQIVLIGAEAADAELAAEARRQGYEVDVVSRDECERKYGVEAAPLLVVLDAEGQRRYAGGYTSRKQVLDVQDEKILTQLLAGEAVEPLPLYGCAVSRSLQSVVDPLGLKSAN